MQKHKLTSNQWTIDKSWTLFLDRDGVINKRLPDNYVKEWSEFKFLKKAKKAIAKFSELFGTIVIVTNQQGVEKGFMTQEQVDQVHAKMIKSIKKKGGRIDKVYTCPNLVKDNSINRKPNIGMPLIAQKDFPNIDFTKSIMVGDSISDIEMGLRLRMKTIFIATKPEAQTKIRIYPIDGHFDSLANFAKALESRK